MTSTALLWSGYTIYRKWRAFCFLPLDLSSPSSTSSFKLDSSSHVHTGNAVLSCQLQHVLHFWSKMEDIISFYYEDPRMICRLIKTANVQAELSKLSVRFTCSRLSSLRVERWGWLSCLSPCLPAPLTLCAKTEREKKKHTAWANQINFLTKGIKYWRYDVSGWFVLLVSLYYFTHFFNSQPWSYLARWVRDSVTFLPV